MLRNDAAMNGGGAGELTTERRAGRQGVGSGGGTGEMGKGNILR